MKITFSELALPTAGALIIGISNPASLHPLALKLDKTLGGAISRAIKMAKFKAEKGEKISLVAPAGCDYDLVVLCGVGKDEVRIDLTAQAVGAAIVPVLNKYKVKKAAFVVEKVKRYDELAANIGYGALLRSYIFDKYRTTLKEEKKPTFKELQILVASKADAEKLFKKLEKVASGVFLARDVVTEPPNKLYPESYAEIVKKELSPLGVNVKILNVKDMEKLGMGSLLGVGQGSVKDSRLVIMEWKGKSGEHFPVALVGKGVTFDTGGISLKPAGGMEDMKYDMGGSAAVVGAIKAIAGRKAKVNVVGVIGLVENMPGGNAQRPSDVVVSMSGQTIEVLNTDAEGRLVLADALWYAQENYKPENIIDLATLTGAITIALGQEYAGLFSNNDHLSETLLKSGKATGEKLWRFPMGDEYDKLIDSPIADMQNISSGKGAGSITAAQFLLRFIKKGTNWAHLDIAGVAWAKEARDVCPKGATAFGVRLLENFIADNFEK
jgi:leucyl aminopeptidase